MSARATPNARSGALPVEDHAARSMNGELSTSFHGRELVLGRLADSGGAGDPRVEFTVGGETRSCDALATIPLGIADVGRSVVIAFMAGDLERPIVLGLVAASAPSEAALQRQTRGSVGGVEDNVILTANRELVLRCGKASVTLTRAGKILIRGAYLLSRSSGVNRIKGASVQIN